MASRRNFNYSRLDVDEDDYYDDGNKSQNDPRFNYTPKTFDKIPWKSIILEMFLLLLGCLLLLLSSFIFSGHMEGESSQAYGLLGLGLLTFLPGFYETRIAYYSWRGAQGYRFRQFSIIDPSASSSHIGFVFSFLFRVMWWIQDLVKISLCCHKFVNYVGCNMLSRFFINSIL